jgi:hypothetical protein
VDGGKPGITAAGSVITFVLEMIEEGTEQLRIQVLDAQRPRRLF